MGPRKNQKQMRTTTLFAVSGFAQVKYGVRSPKFIWAPCAQLYSLAETCNPPYLGSYTRAPLVSQDRRHLFVTPWWRRFALTSLSLIFLRSTRKGSKVAITAALANTGMGDGASSKEYKKVWSSLQFVTCYKAYTRHCHQKMNENWR